jgi:hypothetical protein
MSFYLEVFGSNSKIKSCSAEPEIPKIETLKRSPPTTLRSMPWMEVMRTLSYDLPDDPRTTDLISSSLPSLDF